MLSAGASGVVGTAAGDAEAPPNAEAILASGVVDILAAAPLGDHAVSSTAVRAQVRLRSPAVLWYTAWPGVTDPGRWLAWPPLRFSRPLQVFPPLRPSERVPLKRAGVTGLGAQPAASVDAGAGLPGSHCAHQPCGQGEAESRHLRHARRQYLRPGGAAAVGSAPPNTAGAPGDAPYTRRNQASQMAAAPESPSSDADAGVCRQRRRSFRHTVRAMQAVRRSCWVPWRQVPRLLPTPCATCCCTHRCALQGYLPALQAEPWRRRAGCTGRQYTSRRCAQLLSCCTAARIDVRFRRRPSAACQVPQLTFSHGAGGPFGMELMAAVVGGASGAAAARILAHLLLGNAAGCAAAAALSAPDATHSLLAVRAGAAAVLPKSPSLRKSSFLPPPACDVRARQGTPSQGGVTFPWRAHVQSRCFQCARFHIHSGADLLHSES